MELVKQQNTQKITTFSGATGWVREVAFEIGWRQGFQERQSLLPHCRGIALQCCNGRLECHHLLEGIPSTNVLRVSWHTKLFMPFVSHPGLGQATDEGENGVFCAGLVPE